MREADAAARGMEEASTVTRRMAMKISATYTLKAVKPPIRMAPLSTRRPPNHMMATVEKFRIAQSAGDITANTRITLRPTWRSSRLARSNRRCS